MTISSLKSNNNSIQNQRWVYIVLGILIMMFLGTVYSYSVFRVALEDKFRIGSAESGMPYMFALAFYALSMFFSGKYVGRFKPRVVIIVGGLFVSLGWILSSFATNILMLTITYGCMSGTGVGIAYGAIMNVIARWFPDKKGLAVGLVLVGFGLSPLTTAPSARILVDQFGVMQTFSILGLIFGVFIPLLALSFKYPEDKQASNPKNRIELSSNSPDIPLKEMVQTITFKGLYINFTIGTMIGLMMVGMTTHVGMEHFKLEASLVTSLMALFAVFNGMGRPIFGWITDRCSSRSAMLISYSLIIVAATALTMLDTDPIVYILSFSIFWFNLGGWLAIAPTSTLKLYGIINYSENYGLIFTAYGIGAILGVSSSGLLLDFLGNYRYVFLYIIALGLIGVLSTYRYIQIND